MSHLTHLLTTYEPLTIPSNHLQLPSHFRSPFLIMNDIWEPLSLSIFVSNHSPPPSSPDHHPPHCPNVARVRMSPFSLSVADGFWLSRKSLHDLLSVWACKSCKPCPTPLGISFMHLSTISFTLPSGRQGSVGRKLQTQDGRLQQKSGQSAPHLASQYNNFMIQYYRSIHNST